MRCDKVKLRASLSTIIISFLCILLMCGYAYKYPRNENVSFLDESKKQAEDSTLSMESNSEHKTVIPLSEDCRGRKIIYLDDLIGKRLIFYSIPINESKLISSDNTFCETVNRKIVGNKNNIELMLKDTYAYNVEICENRLEVTYSEFIPSEDKKVVVLSPGEYEGVWDIPLEICGKMSEKLQENDVEVHLTRIDGEIRSTEQKRSLVDITHPDLFLEISFAYENTKTFYNENYYLRNFDNACFAYETEYSVLKVTGGEYFTDTQLSDYDILNELKMPSARIMLTGATVPEEYMAEDWQGLYCNQISDALVEAINTSLLKSGK